MIACLPSAYSNRVTFERPSAALKALQASYPGNFFVGPLMHAKSFHGSFVDLPWGPHARTCMVQMLLLSSKRSCLMHQQAVALCATIPRSVGSAGKQDKRLGAALPRGSLASDSLHAP